MLPYNAVNGQSLYDVCLCVYGSLNYMLKLIKDNNIANIDHKPVSGDVFVYDETINANTSNRSSLSQYATANQRDI